MPVDVAATHRAASAHSTAIHTVRLNIHRVGVVGFADVAGAAWLAVSIYSERQEPNARAPEASESAATG